jgi:hypothetical protein
MCDNVEVAALILYGAKAAMPVETRRAATGRKTPTPLERLDRERKGARGRGRGRDRDRDGDGDGDRDRDRDRDADADADTGAKETGRQRTRKIPGLFVLLHERWHGTEPLVHPIPPLGNGHVDAVGVAEHSAVAALGDRARPASVGEQHAAVGEYEHAWVRHVAVPGSGGPRL